jgi:hypothetical protein
MIKSNSYEFNRFYAKRKKEQLQCVRLSLTGASDYQSEMEKGNFWGTGSLQAGCKNYLMILSAIIRIDMGISTPIFLAVFMFTDMWK